MKFIITITTLFLALSNAALADDFTCDVYDSSEQEVLINFSADLDDPDMISNPSYPDDAAKMKVVKLKDTEDASYYAMVSIAQDKAYASTLSIFKNDSETGFRISESLADINGEITLAETVDGLPLIISCWNKSE